MRTNLIGRLLVLAVLVAAAGCRTYPTYWVNGQNLAKGSALDLDYGYVAPNAADAMISKTLSVRVLDPRQTINPTVSKIKKKNRDWDPYRTNLEFFLADEIWRMKIFKEVSAESDIRPLKNTDLRLDVAITGWDEGNGFLRYLFPQFISPIFRLMRTGPTRVQIEGQMVDTRTGAVVLQFADSRIHPGGPQLGFLTRRPFKADVLISEDLVVASNLLAASLRDVSGVKEKPRARKEYRSKFHDNPTTVAQQTS